MMDGLFKRDWFGWIPDLSPWLYLPSQTVAISAVFAGAGTAILSKYTADLGHLSIPIKYGTLFIAALLTNWLLSDVRLPLDADLQAPIIYAFIGITVAGLGLMILLRRERA
jgi:FtsH-binding integral membrane protein